MKALLFDAWEDLRARRLWPVAALLLAALVATPVFFLERSRESGAAPPPPARPTAAMPALLPGAELEEVRDGSRASRLEVFDPRDPFHPLRSTSPPSSPDPGGDSPAPGGGAAASVASLVASAGGTASSPAGGTAGSGGASAVSRGGVTRTTRTNYTHEVDVRVGERGRERTRRGVKRLQLLPSDRKPLFAFLGISASGDSAVFLVDSQLSQAGEGTCKPSIEACTFLYLRLDPDRDEHFFADAEGTEYTLKLLDIDVVKVSEAESSAARRERRAEGARAHRSRRRPEPPRRARKASARAFLFRPFFVDQSR